MRPSKSEYGEYFSRYIDLVKGDEVIKVLAEGLDTCSSFWNSIPEEKSAYRYAEGKWSIKELLQHLIDTERVFCYRAVSIARGEKASLQGYDHDEYALKSKADNRNWRVMVAEYVLVRKATIALFESFDDNQLGTIGSANGLPLSPRAVGFINAGHEIHHMNVVQERYPI